MINVAWLLIGIMSGSVVTAALLGWHWRRWRRQHIEQQEAKLLSHNLELQIALDELAEKNRLLEQQNMLDTLSGIYNRACFDKRLCNELKRSRREQTPLGLVLIDIDHFKKINDKYGHLAGDSAIQQIASILAKSLKRSSDAAFRYGGEEFALLLPGTNITGCLELAEHVRLQLNDTPLHIGQLKLAVTLSAGCYAAIAHSQSDSNNYIAAADCALYQAKSQGRNQSVSATPAIFTQEISNES
ncbi:diguanylate cyclase (GGDEF) domain-containing protein [Arsukibacterium sp. MJ3]|uniref:GGDEF domain-containing protein n=1 Tax=Arsukibacterium sp. MJ3 TaxID=1632859 RepID=UPI000627120D|nr:GGDEF domain-containing protein [Arsukibacterium sp. MJ3]KKO48461.1 diguanylate cyclase (GGDEF) domain-containing protein [Arsukibacterium sp. MJ3]